MVNEVIRNRFSDDDIYFIIVKKLNVRKLEKMTKKQIIESILNLRDVLDRYN